MKHYNTNILQKISDTFKPKGEMLPDFVDEGITLVYDVEPDINVIQIATTAGATSTTIYTTPADRDFFIKYLQLTVNKDASSLSTSTIITGVIGGVTKTLIRINTTTSVALNGGFASVTLPNGVKLDRNTTLTVTNTDATALIASSGIIMGYIID